MTKKIANIALLAAAALGFVQCKPAKPTDAEVADALFPIPQEVAVTGGWLQLPKEGVKLAGVDTADSLNVAAVQLIENRFGVVPEGQTVIAVTKFDPASADSVLRKSGAYTIQVVGDSVKVGIADDRSLFYAAQTLGQMAQMKPGYLPALSVKDWPEMDFRGVVEGFYGVPWSFDNRVEQLRFYGRNKMNTYIFGPKDDPYHRSPYWREPYPADQAAKIAELVKEAHRNKVDFVWAMHPGMDIKWTEADRKAAVAKLNSMYDLGVRGFAVFFDDIDGEGTDANRQAEFMNYLMTEFVEKKGDVAQLILCPTEYNKAWAVTDYLDVLGEKLNPGVQVMWTGDKVVADITAEGVEWVNKRLRRKAYIWWNFPVNDYVQDHLPMGPSRGLDVNAPKLLSAFVSNPMEHAEASKVALKGVAQYTWNPKRHDPLADWRKGCAELVPEAPEEFMAFCEANGAMGPNAWDYNREESWSVLPSISRVSEAMKAGKELPAADLDTLARHFAFLGEAAAKVKSSSKNAELLREITPWLDQTANVAAAGVKAMEMLRASDPANQTEAFNATVEAMQTIDRFHRPFRNGEKNGVRSGDQALLPFIREALAWTASRPLGGKVALPAAGSLIEGSRCADSLQVYVEDDVYGIRPHFTYILMAPGEYIGYTLPEGVTPKMLTYDLRKFKNNVRAIEASVDGVNWTSVKTDAGDRLDSIAIDPAMRHFRIRNSSQKPVAPGLGRFIVITEKGK